MQNLAPVYQVEWLFGPLHPVSLAKPVSKTGVLPLTDPNHPAWNRQKNAIQLQDLQFESTSVQDSERNKNSQ